MTSHHSPIKGTHLLFLILLGLLLCCPPAHAFRLKAHLWIGQSVINDLKTSTNVTINGKTYAVAPEMRSAILAHPDAYLAGCLGPDIVPDLVVGQMTTHPGIEGGWRSREWLSHVLQAGRSDPATFAFSLGYLSHAASDVFAHTYVNTYAGDVFILTDEQEVEQRHFALESYIDRALPPIAGFDKALPSFSFPKATLAQALIHSGQAQNEYKRPMAVAPHLVLMGLIRNNVKDFGEQVRRLETGLAGVVQDIQKKLDDAKKELIVVSGPVAQLELQIKGLQEAVNVFDAEVALQEKTLKEAEQAINTALGQVEKLNATIADLQNKVTQAAKDVANASDALNKIQKTIVKEVTKYLPWPLDKVIEKVTEINPAWAAQNEVLKRATKHLNDLQQSLERDIREKATQATLAATKATVKLAANAKLAELNLKRGAIDESRSKLAQLKTQLKPLKEKEAELLRKVAEIQSNLTGTLAVDAAKLKPLSRLSTMWLANIDLAIENYIGASESSANALLAKHNPLKPYSDWNACWSAVFAGVPKEIPGTTCLAKDEAEKLAAMVSELHAAIVEKLGDAAWVVDPMGKLKMIAKEKLVPQLKRAAVDVIGQVAGDRTKQMIQLIAFEPDDKLLVKTFTGSTKKNLVEFPDIVQRLKFDLRLNKSGQLDPERFYAIRNAVVLSKIVLLTPAGMDQLAKDHKIKRGWFPSLRAGHPGTDALLTGVLSIDGNHQWRQPTPKYIRRNGTASPDLKLPYAEPNSENYLFTIIPAARPNDSAIFLGPLVPSIDTPAEGGFVDVRPTVYKYRPSANDPFPETD